MNICLIFPMNYNVLKQNNPGQEIVSLDRVKVSCLHWTVVFILVVVFFCSFFLLSFQTFSCFSSCCKSIFFGLLLLWFSLLFVSVLVVVVFIIWSFNKKWQCFLERNGKCVRKRNSDINRKFWDNKRIEV